MSVVPLQGGNDILAAGDNPKPEFHSLIARHEMLIVKPENNTTKIITRPFGIVDNEFHIRAASNQICEYFNTDQDQLIGDDASRYFAKDNRDFLRVLLRRRLLCDTTIPDIYYARFLKKNNVPFSALIRAAMPFSDRKGTKYSIIEILHLVE